MKHKKIVATVLSIAMMVSALPMSVLAEDTAGDTEETVVSEEQVEETEAPEEQAEEPEQEEEPEAEITDETEAEEIPAEQAEVSWQEDDAEVETSSGKAPVYNEGESEQISWTKFMNDIENLEGDSYTLQGDVVRGPNDGAISISKRMNIDLNNHTIDSSESKNNVFLINDSVVTISNGTIIGNKTSQDIKCIYASATDDNKVVELEGVTIKSFGVAIASDYQVVLTDCTITDNTYSFFTDGYLAYKENKIDLKGDITIKNNYQDVYLLSGDTIDISHITGNSKIGISMYEEGEFTDTLTDSQKNLKSCFFSTDKEYYVALENDRFVLKRSNFTVSSWSELSTAINTIESKGYITLAGDCVASSNSGDLSVSKGKDISIDLKGYKIDRNSGGRVISNAGTLTITDTSNDKSGEITGGRTSGVGAGIENKSTGRLNLSGGSITGNNQKSLDANAKYGAGVYNAGTMYINGGNITDNNTSDSIIVDGHYEGGGIYNVGEIHFYSGTISGNKAYSGAGIYNHQGTVNIYSGTGAVISGNRAELSSGATYGGTTFGGGLYNHWGTVNIKGGEFTQNQAHDGGAIFNAGTLNITGGAYHDNSAYNGGAIYNGYDNDQMGNASIKNVTIENNTAVYSGGAICNAHRTVVSTSTYSTMTLEDVLFFNNGTTSTDTSSGKGGAIYNTGNLTITSETQTNPNVLKNGCGQNAAKNGGAIYNEHELSITNWWATYNSANNGGAIYNKGTLSLKGTEICANNATSNGGGIFLEDDVTIDGYVKLQGNTVDDKENNLYLGSNKVVIPEGEDISDDTLIGITYDVDTGKDSYVFTDGYYRTGKTEAEFFVSDTATNVIKFRPSTSATFPDAELEIHTYQPNYITYCNLSLRGDIATNVYFMPADDLDADASSVKVTGPNGSNIYSLSEIIDPENFTEDCGYKIAYPVYARQMFEEVTYTFTVKDTDGKTQDIYYKLSTPTVIQNSKISYSVSEYLNIVLNDSNSGQFDTKTKNLCDALDVYCKLASIQFGTTSSVTLDSLDLDNPVRKNNAYAAINSSTLEQYNRTLETLGESSNYCRFDYEGQDPVYKNIQYTGMSFVDYSEPALRLYFKEDIRYADFEVGYGSGIQNWGTYSNKYHDPLTAKVTTGEQDGLYYIEIPGMLFDDFDKKIYVYFCTDLHFGDHARHSSYCIGASPLSYAYLVAKDNNNAGTTMYYFAKAMYQLNKRMEEYKG